MTNFSEDCNQLLEYPDLNENYQIINEYSTNTLSQYPRASLVKFRFTRSLHSINSYNNIGIANSRKSW